jgi:hypothetical protein
MPIKKTNETALRLAEDAHAVMHVGDSGAAEQEKVDREEDSKPLYLRRI